MLYFDFEKYDFWKIYDTIKHFYPIGIKKDDSNMYLSYPGIKDLERILVEKIHDQYSFTNEWEEFTKDIEHQTGKEVIGTTYGQAPCFSSFVLLDSTTTGNIIRTKQLHFFVSAIGTYYTVIGQDKNTMKAEDSNFESTNCLALSPVNEFSDLFKLLCEKIEVRFKGYLFVPFGICRQTIEGLDVRYGNDGLNTVFNALFNDHINVNTLNTIGTDWYKNEDWIKQGYVEKDSKWAAYPPGIEKYPDS
jgi:hypothetical protein